ncbi:MAG: protein required for attachment to host cells-like protein [Xanthobacteraceae bacterium]|nr:MAG: protein required for attachment to host cells-like protein [Xanthobacteraceae bacterium]
MTEVRIPRDALVFVGDGAKALFLRNKGDAGLVNLVVERIFEQENPATHDQGTDRPGRSFSSAGTHRSAMEQTDWHQLAEDRFVGEVADALYKQAHAGRFETLIVVAPPKVLGNLRKAFHKEVSDRVSAEVPKDLTKHPVHDIERLLAA